MGGIRDTAKAAGMLLIGRVLSFRERTGIRSGDPYFAMLPRSSGPSTHILHNVLKMSEIRLRPVLPFATPTVKTPGTGTSFAVTGDEAYDSRRDGRFALPQFDRH